MARWILPRPTPTPAGDKPPRYIFSFRHRPSVYNSAGFARGEPASRLIGGDIPDRSPGHAFVPIADAGWRRHAKVGKAGIVAWYSELARRILPRPTPTPAGDKPPRYIFSFRHRPPVYKSPRFARGGPASRLIGVHIPDRSPGHAFVRMTKWTGDTTRFAGVTGNHEHGVNRPSPIGVRDVLSHRRLMPAGAGANSAPRAPRGLLRGALPWLGRRQSRRCRR